MNTMKKKVFCGIFGKRLPDLVKGKPGNFFVDTLIDAFFSRNFCNLQLKVSLQMPHQFLKEKAVKVLFLRRAQCSSLATGGSSELDSSCPLNPV